MIKVNKKTVIFIVLSFAFAYFEGGYLPYVVFYSFFVPFVLSFIILAMQCRNINVDIKFDKDIISRKEEVKLTQIIKNYNILPISCVELKNKILYSLEPLYNGEFFNMKIDENKRINRVIKFSYRGIYDFGDITLTFKDYLYIVTLSKKMKKNFKVRVYPRVQDICQLSFPAEEFVKNILNSKGLMQEDYSVGDIRKYIIGDSLKKIHWKLSAKYGELYVKKFDALQGEEYNIFLNMNKEDYFTEGGKEKEEELIEGCISIINYVLTNNIKSGIHIHNKENMSMYINTKEDFSSLMEYFLLHESEGDEKFSSFLIDNFKKVRGNSTVIVFTPKVNEEIRETLLSISKSGYKVKVFCQSNSKDTIENTHYLKTNSIEVINSILRKDVYE
ncbi:hypothetical protein GCM10008905_26160 [Clostridium malenominatum]|uniref:DUF58 domain-containing protein n=1 Tax=Clostridium malenominatum TaxID=1539 RepID=A0ABP3UCP3_9CLOT